ncbi:23351_t:CDS:2, partial [Gigaspora margarita]
NFLHVENEALEVEVSEADVSKQSARYKKGLAKGMDKIEDISSDKLNTMIDTNVKGLIYVTQAVLPRMKGRQKDHIIYK